MIYDKIASEKFYYCHGCKRFHEYGNDGHKAVNRKLCFYCGKMQTKKTKIVGKMETGHMQICDKCNSKYELGFV